jgi:hypothetical protein
MILVDIIRYIYTDSLHQNSLNRVAIAGDSDNNFDLAYDREKYNDMLLDGLKLCLGSSDLTGHCLESQRTKSGGWS